MTEIDTNEGATRRPISQQAVASLVCSGLLCCPVTSLVGIFLGLRAMRAIRLSAGALRGGRVARLGVVVGSLSLILQFVLLSGLANTAAEKARLGASRGIRLMFDDPEAALDDGWAVGPGGRLRADDLQQAVDQMVAQHGGFERVAITTGFSETDSGVGRLGAGVTLFFEDGEVFGRVEVLLVPVNAWPFIDARVAELLLGDEEAGEIVLPPR